MLSKDPVVQVGEETAKEREMNFVGWRNAASGLLESSPLYHASPQGTYSFFMEISLVAHLRAGGKSLGCGRGDSTCFPGPATGGDTGVSRNEAQQSHGVICVCAQGSRWLQWVMYSQHVLSQGFWVKLFQSLKS